MARTPLILDGLNLNDGTVYRYMPGAELGARQKTWTERRSYTGAVAQYNVSEAASIPMKFPMLVQGTSLADLDAKVRAVNARIDGCSSAAPKDLVFAGMTYQITTTPRIAYTIGESARATFWTFVDLVLNRVPNSNLIPPRTVSLAGVSKVVYIGDSLTMGYWATTEALGFRPMLDSWLATLGIAAGTELYSVAGSDSIHASAPAELANYAAENADLAFIELGTNDYLGYSQTPWAPTPLPEFAANMRAISNAVRTNSPGCVMVYLTTWGRGQTIPTWPREYDAVIRWIADEFGGVVVNLDAVFQDNSANYLPSGVATWIGPSDGWHPNDNGHRDISRITKVAMLSGWPAGWLRRGERSNYAPNPRLVDGGSGLPSFWTDVTAGHGTKVLSVVADGDAFYQLAGYTVHADDLLGEDLNVAFRLIDDCAGVFAAGDPVTAALEYQLVVSNARSCSGGLLSLYTQDFGAGASSDMVVASAWTPVSFSIAALPAGVTSMIWFVTVVLHSATGVAGDTVTLRFRRPILSKTPAAVPFFHGASTADDRWLDVADFYARRYLATAASGVYTLLADTDYENTTMATALVPVAAGRPYRASANVEITERVGGTFWVGVEWFDADGILFTSSILGELSAVGVETLTSTLTAPVGATHACVGMCWGNGVPGSPGNATGACAATVSDIYLYDV